MQSYNERVSRSTAERAVRAAAAEISDLESLWAASRAAARFAILEIIPLCEVWDELFIGAISKGLPQLESQETIGRAVAAERFERAGS